MPARIIKTTGAIVEVGPANGKHFQLEELQAIVGGYIEVVRLPDGQLMFANEDGLSQGLPFNSLASSYYRAKIVGDVLITSDDLVE